MLRISESGEHEVDSKTSSTTTAEAARRRARNYIYRGKVMDGLDTKALDHLPPSMLVYPKKRHNHPKHYHFGFGVSLEQLCDYFIARDLVSNDWHGKRLYNTVMVRKAMEEINRLCGTKFYLQNVWNLDHQWVLARYSNYTWHRSVMRDRDEGLLTEVLQRSWVFANPQSGTGSTLDPQLAEGIIRRELCICEVPKWFWRISPVGPFRAASELLIIKANSCYVYYTSDDMLSHRATNTRLRSITPRPLRSHEHEARNNCSWYERDIGDEAIMQAVETLQ